MAVAEEKEGRDDGEEGTEGRGREWDRRELPSEWKGEEYNSKQGFRTKDIHVLFLWHAGIA